MPWKQTSPKKFRQWQRTYWQGLSKIWRAGFNLVWTQMLATSSTCYDVVTFLTQRMYSCSNFVTISSLVLELLKKCWVSVASGTLSQHFTNNFSLHTTLTLDTVMNRERPTFVGFCSSIPTCVIVSSTFFTMGNREFLHCLSLFPQGKSKTGIFQRLSKTA